jgi:hypothetical protein
MHSIKQGCGRLTADVVSCDSRRMVKDGGLILKLALRIEGFAWPLSPDTPSYPTPAPDVPNHRTSEQRHAVPLRLYFNNLLTFSSVLIATAPIELSLRSVTKGCWSTLFTTNPFFPKGPLATLNLLSLAQFPSQSPVAQNLSTLST